MLTARATGAVRQVCHGEGRNQRFSAARTGAAHVFARSQLIGTLFAFFVRVAPHIVFAARRCE
jgi:hypothetical protein